MGAFGFFGQPKEERDAGMDQMEDDFVEGYRDGGRADSPNPSDNRTYAYRHGFANGRDDLNKKPRDSAANLREQAQAATIKDASR